MQNKILTVCVLAMLGSPVWAEQAVTLGYSQGKVRDGDTVRGVNVKYNHELNERWGIIGSVSYMEGDESGLQDSSSIAPDVLANGNRDTTYYSLAAGPSYRVNDMFSVYGLVGVGHTKAETSADWMNHVSGSYQNSGRVSESQSKTGVNVGVGVQVRPVQNLTVDLAYEGARSTNATASKPLNAVSLGVGYRF